MAASNDTTRQAAKILIEELGVEKARQIIMRLLIETEGNASYEATIRKLASCLRDWKKEEAK